MKRYLPLFLVALISILFYSCSNDEKKSEEKETTGVAYTSTKEKYNFEWFENYWGNSCDYVGGMANFVIRHTLADSMINHYDTIYDKDDADQSINALLNNYWIDSCTIFAISKYLKTTAKYDGIRFSFGCSTIKEPGSYPGQQYQNTSTIFIYPTTISATGHKDSTEIVIPVPNCTTSNYIKPYPEASGKISVFDKIYRKRSKPGNPALKDSLSQGVWIDSCVVYFIEKLIRENKDTLDGVNIKLAAYLGNETTSPRGKFKPHQSTMIIVPTSPAQGDPNTHIDNWEIIEILMKKKAKAFSAGLNHGELCPNKCD
ncbi:MAG TPA: hypothetical protein VK498_02285 [Ferruginibacter sp.]|nr:hypothetical protein [Ferruginibacter sp.]